MKYPRAIVSSKPDGSSLLDSASCLRRPGSTQDDILAAPDASTIVLTKREAEITTECADEITIATLCVLQF
jgi:hypothetical protein